MKFICRKCTPEKPCVLEIEDFGEYPFSCPFDLSDKEGASDWKPLGVCGSDRFEIHGICSDCARNDETCSMGPSCKDASNFEPKGLATHAESFVDKTCPDPKARYYDAGGVEVLDVIKAKLTPEQFKGWLLGNLIKYSCRANHKGQFARDVEKVSFYSGELFGFLEV